MKLGVGWCGQCGEGEHVEELLKPKSGGFFTRLVIPVTPFDSTPVQGFQKFDAIYDIGAVALD